jgi:hypothetical protein
MIYRQHWSWKDCLPIWFDDWYVEINFIPLALFLLLIWYLA